MRLATALSVLLVLSTTIYAYPQQRLTEARSLRTPLERPLPRAKVHANDAPVLATGVGSLVGNVAYQEQGSNLEILVDQIVNNSSMTSGTLRVEVWATLAPYDGTAQSGFRLGYYQLPDPLGPGQSVSNIDQIVPYTAPPAGVYYIDVLLTEFDGTQYDITDFRTSDTTVTAAPATTPPPAQAAAAVALRGRVSWQEQGGQLTINADHVTNLSSALVSGALQLQVWATATPYAGGTIRGYIIGSYALPSTLGAGQSFDGISQTVSYMPPPDGSYYTTVVIAEATDTQIGVSDYVTFNSTTAFATGADPQGPCQPARIGTNFTPLLGTLTAASCVVNGYATDFYTFHANAGQIVAIGMLSNTFYSYLTLYAPGSAQPYASNFEGLSDGLSTVVAFAPTAGDYIVGASSNDPTAKNAPGALGVYAIGVSLDGAGLNSVATPASLHEQVLRHATRLPVGRKLPHPLTQKPHVQGAEMQVGER